ncbi:MAG: alpha-amylase family glycosyl hydrolase [Niabella sp.]
MKRCFLPFILLVLLWSCKKNDPSNDSGSNPSEEPVTVSFTGLITTDKTFPSADESFTLVFDPAKGNEALSGFSGDVYLYAGVITDKSTGSDDWKYVKSSSFTEPDAASKMTRQTNGTYSISITPRSFFGVPSTEKILKVAMLFRTGDGNTVTRNADGSNIYLPIYDAGTLNVRFAAPEMQPTYTLTPTTGAVTVGQELTVTAAGSASASLVLTLNGTPFATASNATAISGKAVFTEAGQQTIKVTANGTTESSFTVIASGTVQVADLPGGAAQGVTFSNNGTSATFAVYAPGKSFINVVGDFNSWTPNATSFMKRTPDGNIWWTTIDGLDAGTQYAYQYWVDGTLKIADPYTEKILDPDNDASIPAANNSNFGTYPTGKTTGIVSTFKANETAYSWQNTSFTKPAKNNLVIYELLVRDFLGNNNYKTLTDTLNYLSSLGVNAVELMPVNEFEGNSSWGYNPDFYFAPDKYYGTKTALQKVIDLCHSKGIAVILDVVFNHSMGQSPMVQLYWDKANSRPAADNPWFNAVAPHSAITFGYDFNHESTATQSFVKDVLKFWLQEYKVDGYRFDFTKGFTQKVTSTNDELSAYDASRIAILKDYNTYIKSIDPDAFVILEHFCADAEEQELASGGMMLWNNLNYNFNEATMGWLTNSNFSRADYKTHGFSAADGLVTYMESHDEERLMYKNLAYGNASGTYDIKSLNTALKRQEMAAAFFFAMPGPKMIWQFGELGYDISIEQNDRTGEKPVLWEYNQQPARVALKNAFSKFIGFKKNNSAFNTSNFTYDLSSAVKYIRLQDATNTVVVVGNFDVVSQQASVSMGSSGTWYDATNNNEPFSITGSTYTAVLTPGEYHIFSTHILQ